jgi:hypothetical protein
MPKTDLHLHSTFSDGLLTPEEIVTLAIRAHLPAIAITDHDCIDGVEPARSAAAGTGLLVIPAVELSAVHDSRSLHILGYHIDIDSERLRARLAHLRSARLERARSIVDALRADGYELDPDEILRPSSEGAVGRAHIARQLIEQGAARDMDDAFVRFLADDAPYYVPKPSTPAEAAISWVIDSGGVPVLAHPGLSRVDDLIPALVGHGLAGLEAYHASHDPATATRYVEMAERYGLIVTGGSDFHGSEREGGPIGSSGAPDDPIRRLEAARIRREGSR